MIYSQSSPNLFSTDDSSAAGKYEVTSLTLTRVPAVKTRSVICVRTPFWTEEVALDFRAHGPSPALQASPRLASAALPPTAGGQSRCRLTGLIGGLDAASRGRTGRRALLAS